MLFSYYFNAEKTHRLNCRFEVLQFSEKAAGVIEIMFSAEINEIMNGIRKKKEVNVATFSFPPTPEGQVKHDIDFTRVRYGDDKKWIFTVINNKDNNQKLSVGLISETANKNPLGMDIFHDDDEFDVELKANNLAILEPNYVAPVLTQTMVNTQFAQPGYPERFGSLSASYDSIYQNYKVSDFTQGFLEPIPAGSKFKIQLDLAPKEVVPLDGNELFGLTIPNLGSISLLTNGLEYKVKDADVMDIVRAFFPEHVKPEDFWNNGMTPKARLTIEGNGEGILTVRYFDTSIIGAYDHNSTFSGMEFLGALARLDNDSEDPNQNGTNNPDNWIKVILDNITVIYQK
jgi:hypothetical protein